MFTGNPQKSSRQVNTAQDAALQLANCSSSHCAGRQHAILPVSFVKISIDMLLSIKRAWRSKESASAMSHRCKLDLARSNSTARSTVYSARASQQRTHCTSLHPSHCASISCEGAKASGAALLASVAKSHRASRNDVKVLTGRPASRHNDAVAASAQLCHVGSNTDHRRRLNWQQRRQGFAEECNSEPTASDSRFGGDLPLFDQQGMDLRACSRSERRSAHDCSRSSSPSEFCSALAIECLRYSTTILTSVRNMTRKPFDLLCNCRSPLCSQSPA